MSLRNPYWTWLTEVRTTRGYNFYYRRLPDGSANSLEVRLCAWVSRSRQHPELRGRYVPFLKALTPELVIDLQAWFVGIKSKKVAPTSTSYYLVSPYTPNDNKFSSLSILQIKLKVRHIILYRLLMFVVNKINPIQRFISLHFNHFTISEKLQRIESRMISWYIE